MHWAEIDPSILTGVACFILGSLLTSLFNLILSRNKSQPQPTTINTPTSANATTNARRESISLVRPSASNEKAPSATTDSSPSSGDKSDSRQSSMLSLDQLSDLTDEQVKEMTISGRASHHMFEKLFSDLERAVKLRRSVIEHEINMPLEGVPYENYDYKVVHGACCENVIGYVPIPLGVAGPLVIDGRKYTIPLATTEGALVASTNRGCKAINMGGGARTEVTKEGMTRGPVVRFPSATRAAALVRWIQVPTNANILAEAFNSTSSYARLQSITPAISGRQVFLRIRAITGDAMGMNMISKGVQKALDMLAESFQDMEVVSISGNYCCDKKPAAINWIEGRGKSVVGEAIIPGDVVRSVLKTDVARMVDTNISKNLIGSAMAGSIGGFNAHSSNLVTAIYIACGQDPAQNVESSNCMTMLER
eukprot:TRINITY_DN4035_c0_g5_i2.p1 TRINITY_DN4035_c0_g5~~TRINITY_DN4035_c0_g5_i2.p1  ORF type:complete len:423 (+),score=88.67 TRINITY_DN4035_c0_g5_i2:78-1346(+)